ncbi:ATP-binding protein [Breoghania sp.]|uniref:ATP-binding protein n=1 Tax=Breoghania sp. TaxID=2065378 RepID=UPI00260693A1|nr:ATP-binding protein [Breoghania sp.]MDJ0930388.1 ATP-binding protein [Breoghania sp.]
MLIEILRAPSHGTGEIPAKNGTLRLTARVHDTGIDLTTEAAGRLFTEFEQVDLGPARRYGGTGLGLAISQRIVEAMNGRISIDSEPGQGATFSFDFDVAAGKDTALPNRADFADRRIGLLYSEGMAVP